MGQPGLCIKGYTTVAKSWRSISSELFSQSNLSSSNAFSFLSPSSSVSTFQAGSVFCESL
jgi:hypothetical protein